MPIMFLPHWLQKFALLLPTYHLSQLVLSCFGYSTPGSAISHWRLGAVVDQADGQRRVRFSGNLVVQQNGHIRRGGDSRSGALDIRRSLNLRDCTDGTLGVRSWGRCCNHQHRHEEQHRNSPRDHIALPLLPAITAFTPERAFRAALWHTVERDENPFNTDLIFELIPHP